MLVVRFQSLDAIVLSWGVWVIFELAFSANVGEVNTNLIVGV